MADADVLLPEHGDQHHPEWHHRRDEEVEQPVDRALQRRPRMPELPGLAYQLAPRSCLRRRRTRDAPAPSTTNDPDRTSSPGPRDGPRLAGEDRLVELEPVARTRRPSATTWSPGPSLTSRPRRPPRRATSARRRRARRPRAARRAPPARPACAWRELLPDPDAGVRDDDAEEERVTPVAEDERHEPERGQDHVEGRDDVRPDDARRRAARGGRLALATRREARRRLGAGQPRSATASPAAVTRRADRPCRSSAPVRRSPPGARRARPRPPAARTDARAGAARRSTGAAPASPAERTRTAQRARRKAAALDLVGLVDLSSCQLDEPPEELQRPLLGRARPQGPPGRSAAPPRRCGSSRPTSFTSTSRKRSRPSTTMLSRPSSKRSSTSVTAARVPIARNPSSSAKTSPNSRSCSRHSPIRAR